MIYVYREVKADGTVLSSWYPISIPHPKTTDKKTVPILPNYTKGKHQQILTLTDGSKVFIYAKDSAECTKMIDAAKGIINPAKLDPKIMLKDGEINAVDGFEVKTVKLWEIHYYSQGMKRGTIPDWRKRI